MLSGALKGRGKTSSFDPSWASVRMEPDSIRRLSRKRRRHIDDDEALVVLELKDWPDTVDYAAWDFDPGGDSCFTDSVEGGVPSRVLFKGKEVEGQAKVDCLLAARRAFSSMARGPRGRANTKPECSVPV